MSNFSLASGLTLIGWAPATTAADSGYFLNLAAGYGKLQFSPLYHFEDGSPAEKFDDHEKDFVASLGAGYRLQLADGFSLDLGADFIYQNAEWTLTLPREPADFRYEIPYTFGVRLAPAWEPAPRWRLYAELGYAYGRIKERKSSPVTSSYDTDDWTGGWLAGAGIGYQLNNQMDLTLGYRQLHYEELDYKSYLPDGTHWETIEDSPRSEYVSLGLEYRF